MEAEIQLRTPKYELHETDDGMDGYNAITKLKARFDTEELAKAWLTRRGYTYLENDSYAHIDVSRRHCMGKISYTILEAKKVPENPE
jgi:hypothetical protein